MTKYCFLGERRFVGQSILVHLSSIKNLENDLKEKVMKNLSNGALDDMSRKPRFVFAQLWESTFMLKSKQPNTVYYKLRGTKL